MKEQLRRKLAVLWGSVLAAGIMLTAAPVLADDGDLDSAISAGFGKLVKYGRWTAALVLAVVFVLAWAEKGQNSENPHEAVRAGRRMLWSGIGFVVVIGYQMVLTGLVKWFNLDPGAIPSFLWQ
jgi:hypothetical protein